jgi:hypothetical protein
MLGRGRELGGLRMGVFESLREIGGKQISLSCCSFWDWCVGKNDKSAE